MQQDLKQEKVNREAWKKSFVPPYFSSEWGQAFLRYAASLNDSTGSKENNNNNKTLNFNKNNFYQTSENDFMQNEQKQEPHPQQILVITTNRSDMPPTQLNSSRDQYVSDRSTNNNNNVEKLSSIKPLYSQKSTTDSLKTKKSIYFNFYWQFFE